MTAPGSTAPPMARLVAERDSDVVDAVREAASRGTPLRLSGAGTWLDAGRPVVADATLDLSRLSGIVEYVAGDLTLTARAGTSLAEIDEAVRSRGQWLPLDPAGSRDGTLGATLATGSPGPLSASIGAPRDAALGIAFVDGEGRLVRAGGRVVKNVAGFDLVRLTVGAWGTLGVIVEATVRLRALPEVDETFALHPPAEPDNLVDWLRAIRMAPVAPLAAELLSASLARQLEIGEEATLLVRVAGNADAVRAQRDVLARLAAARQAPADVWDSLRAAEPPATVSMRLSRRPSELARVWHAAHAIVEPAEGAAHATLERGRVRCWASADRFDAAGVHALDRDVKRVFERLPAAAWATLAHTPVTDPLARELLAAFDPRRILNPGVIGEIVA